MCKDLLPNIVLVAGDKITASCDFGYLPTLRAIYKGTREVYACDVLRIIEHLGDKQAYKVEPKAAYDWLKTASDAEVKSFTSASPENKLFFATVGPRDVLFLPAGFCFLEKILKVDLAAIKCSLLSTKDGDRLDKINRHLLAIDKPSAALQRYTDCLASQ